MTRQVYYVFGGSSRLPESSHDLLQTSNSTNSSHVPASPHESPAVMTVPLVILAAFAMLLGFIGTPAWPWFQSFLDGKQATFSFAAFYGFGVLQVMLTSSSLVFVGLGLGWWFYGRRPIETAESPDAIGELQPQAFFFLGHAFFVDAHYGATLVRLNTWWAKLCDWLGRWVWNGAVQTVSYLVLVVAWLDNFFDASVVNSGFDEGCEGVSRSGQILSLLQGGQVQSYMAVIGCALIALVTFLLWGGQAMIAFPWITLLTTVPIVGALVLLVLGGRTKLARWSALAFSFAALVLTLPYGATLIPRRAAFSFKRGTHGFLPWAWSIASESMGLGC